MKKQYNLIGYIDREDVDYGFLIPIYQKEEKLFFHTLSEDSQKIIDFKAYNEKQYDHDKVFKSINIPIQRLLKQRRRHAAKSILNDLKKDVEESPTFIFKCFNDLIVGTVHNIYFREDMENCVINPKIKNEFLKKEVYKIFKTVPRFNTNIQIKSSPGTRSKVEVVDAKESSRTARDMFNKMKERFSHLMSGDRTADIKKNAGVKKAVLIKKEEAKAPGKIVHKTSR
jgi:hypothetical protein